MLQARRYDGLARAGPRTVTSAENVGIRAGVKVTGCPPHPHRGIRSHPPASLRTQNRHLILIGPKEEGTSNICRNS